MRGLHCEPRALKPLTSILSPSRSGEADQSGQESNQVRKLKWQSAEVLSARPGEVCGTGSVCRLICDQTSFGQNSLDKFLPFAMNQLARHELPFLMF
jgi:hypothetical protein